MNFRARLSLFALESRENPSGPSPIDPIGGTTVPQDPTDPALTTTVSDPVADAVAAAAAAVVAATTPSDPLLDTNSVYNVPLVP